MKYTIKLSTDENSDTWGLIVDQDGRLCYWDESQGWSEYGFPDKHLYEIVWHPEGGDVIINGESQ